MRIDVKKFLFVGLDEDRVLFFSKAQELGFIHFIETHAPRVGELPPEVQKYMTAIKILRGLPVSPQNENVAESDADEIVNTIVSLHGRMEKLLEESRLLKLEISRVAPFGDFRLDDIAYIKQKGNRILQYYCIKTGTSEDLEFPPELIYVASEHGLDYFVAINTEPKQYEKFVEMKIERPLGSLLKRQQEVFGEIAKLQDLLKGNSQYNKFLHHAFIAKLNHYNLQTAREYARHTLEGSLFVVEGWVPVDKVDKMQALTENLSVHAEEIAVEPNDAVPTYLDNKGFSRIGEDLVHIYDTPSIFDKDPSLWVLCAFSLFFAMIVGDGGYGSIYLGLALYLRYKFPNLKGLGKRLLNLMTILCVACIAWGFLTTSFFGISFGIDNPMRKISLIQWLVEKKTAFHMAHQDDTYHAWIKKFPELAQAKDPITFLKEGAKIENGAPNYEILASFSDNILMELALLFGVVHLLISMFRYLPRNWVNLGWIFFLIGAYLYFPYYLEVPSVINYVGGIEPKSAGETGLHLIMIGIPLAVILSIYKHGIAGLADIMGVIQIFSDSLSYLRLYALGLAGSIVASTINMMADLPIVIAVILMAMSHLVNMALGIMSGVIHGLRLNFLEWYHYSFEGGGKRFRPLELLKKD